MRKAKNKSGFELYVLWLSGLMLCLYTEAQTMTINYDMYTKYKFIQYNHTHMETFTQITLSLVNNLH